MAQFELTDPAGFKTTRFDGDLVFKSNQKAIQRQQQAAAFRKHPVVTRANTVLQNVAIFMRFMTTSQENTWKTYKEFWTGYRSFYNAFIKNNVQKQYPFTFNIESVMGITSPPQIPNTPHDFTAGYCATIDRILLEWQYDTPGEAYVGAAYKRLVSGTLINLDNIRILGGDLAALEFYEVPDTLLTYSSKLLMTIRYCNMRGEVSPWCDPIVIELPDPPEVDFSGTPLSDVSPLTVMFTNLTTGSASRWLWKFGDGESSTDKNPTHTYDGPEAYYTVSLTAWGCANVKRTKTHRNYVHVLDDLTYDTIAFICDTDNNRIFKRYLDGWDYIDKVGSLGSGNDEFNMPMAVCADWEHIFITDKMNNRVVKRLKSDLSFVAAVGSSGSGNNQFLGPMGICCDYTYIWVCDYANQRIHKRLKSDLSLVAMFNYVPSGTGKWEYPFAITCDADYLYFTDHENSNVLTVNKSDGSFVHSYHPTPDPLESVMYLHDITVDSTFFWLSVTSSDFTRVMKVNKGSYTIVGIFQTDWLFFEDQYNGVAVNSSFLWLSNLRDSQILRINRLTYNILSTYGGLGTSNTKYNEPRGMAIANSYSIAP